MRGVGIKSEQVRGKSTQEREVEGIECCVCVRLLSDENGERMYMCGRREGEPGLEQAKSKPRALDLDTADGVKRLMIEYVYNN